jgi:hypothetical protein
MKKGIDYFFYYKKQPVPFYTLTGRAQLGKKGDILLL